MREVPDQPAQQTSSEARPHPGPSPFQTDDGINGAPKADIGFSSDEYDAILRSRPRRSVLPAILFCLTCLSTFWVGMLLWDPSLPGATLRAISSGDALELRVAFLENWTCGLIYMACVMTILFSHEMGHFVATLLYRVPASYPFFLPFPGNPIGTLGAVIAMHGQAADRKQIFDIGIAGPLAGLVPAIPIAFYGVSQLDLTTQPYGGFGFRLPLLLDWWANYCQVSGYETGDVVWLNQLNPWFVAGWVGCLITGLNMMPIGQLDGGHITYTLFGRTAHWIAKALIVFAFAYMVYHTNFMLILMVVLLLFVGIQHPPTRDDSVPLGGFRYLLGLSSLLIPFLCFPPQIFKIAN
ncbi:MAG: site-2 protease family protein [Planctomycetota bacterium]